MKYLDCFFIKLLNLGENELKIKKIDYFFVHGMVDQMDQINKILMTKHRATVGCNSANLN